MATQNYSLIIVDDDEDDRFLCEHVFAQSVWKDHVLLLDSGEDLLNYLANLPSTDYFPALILLDYNMPRYNGEEVYRQLQSRADYSSIKVAFYSSGMTNSLKKRLAVLQPTGYFLKPANAKEFLQLAEQLYVMAQPFGRMPLQMTG